MAGRGRGRHKVFLGMAAGVGKTYRMLQEGQAEAEAGRDVVIGYLEPHGRAETAAQARASSCCRAGASRYRDRRSRRWTCRRSSARAPELCLIDELAHTNAPGVEHDKRYEDVEDVLARGHRRLLDGQRPAPRVAQRPRRRADRHRACARRSRRVLAEADEVVLVDLTPEALIARLRAGKVYPRERVEAGAPELLQDREPRGAARGRAAPGRRGGRVQAPPRPSVPLGTREAADRRRRAAGDRRTAARAGQARAELPAPRPPGLALGAAARRRARPPLGRAPGASPTREEREQLERAAAPGRRCSARTCSSSTATTSSAVAAGSPRARHHLRADGQPRPRRGLAGCGEPLPVRLMRAARRRRAHRRRPLARRRGARRP